MLRARGGYGERVLFEDCCLPTSNDCAFAPSLYKQQARCAALAVFIWNSVQKKLVGILHAIALCVLADEGSLV